MTTKDECVTLLDHLRDVMSDRDFMRRFPSGVAADELLQEVHKRAPGRFCMVSVVDVADVMREFYGPGVRL